ncbi:hypothetical protein BD410DRAFT_803857 [Rickenella mellea]|uniref:CS domain-containing protein n=1 Tax=Rickenella mellea TaxID=50990 RepID=A0A4Y7Q315_9AGAM|nr:hypothetical protein BD410DRAFT_803857 [Rickenella mellea]
MAPKVRRAPVLWAQQSSDTDETKNRINITVNLPDIIASTIRCEVTKTTLSFDASVGSPEERMRYTFNCILYAEVKSEDLKTSLEPEFFSIVLPKAKKGVPWPQLTKQSIPVRKLSTFHGTKGSLETECVRLGVAELEQVIANLERGGRINQDGDTIRRESLYSMVSRNNGPATIPSVGGATSGLESIGQMVSGGSEDDPSILNNFEPQILERSDLNLHEDIGNLNLMLQDLERAVHSMHPDQPALLGNLGVLFLHRFNLLGDIADINQAILYTERAVQLTPEGDLDMPSRLHVLGTSFFERFKRHGVVADIEQAVLTQERAVQLTPDGHRDKPECFTNLGNSFATRFERLGDMADIERAILNHESAVQLAPDGHPEKPLYLSNLGCAFLMRFQRLGEVVDIEHSIFNLKHAVRLAPDGHREKALYLSNLGKSFDKRFGRLGKIADIEQAILNGERAIQLTPDGHHSKPDYLSDLGTSYWKRFDRLRQVMDIENAILNHERAVQLMPDGHPEKPMYLSNLGNSFWTRFELFGNMADIDQAIMNQERAVQLVPDGHSQKSHQLNNLGNSLSRRFVKTRRYEDVGKSIAAFRTSAQMQDCPPSARLYAAKKWSWLARFELGRHPSGQSVLDAYKFAFDLLPRAAWVGLSIDSRHHELLAASSLACDAAAAAISANRPLLALEWLEQGRSIVWGQILQLRAPVDELRIAHRNLAADVARISEQLERGTSGDHFTVGRRKESGDGAVQKHRQLARDWDRIVELVRQKPGFERFLLPRQFSELRHAARDCLVIVLNVSEYGCDALIIEYLSEHPHHVRLEDFSYKKAQTLRQALRNILSHQRLRDRSVDRKAGPAFAGSLRGGDAFRPILAELWKSVVKPVLERLESLQIHSVTGDKYLNITWCPTGPLAFLPIHAAGLYNADGTSSISLPDIAISSYTPTLTALLRNCTPDRSVFKLLAVIQPNTPGVTPLPGTLEELKIIRKHVSNSSSHILQGQSATTSKVLSHMEKCSWVHLACHGVQDVSRPMESGLLLQDGRLELSKIIQKHIHHADFAFLSACQTATGDETHPEEAVHLAAGMLLAGYRGVVATMWSIRDDDAPFIADKVYTRLLDNGQPTGAKGAEALHLAIQELRKKPGGCGFSSWVPFVYMGV